MRKEATRPKVMMASAAQTAGTRIPGFALYTSRTTNGCVLTAAENPMSSDKQVTTAQIEKMYDQGDNRVTQERNDFLLPQVIDLVREDRWVN